MANIWKTKFLGFWAIILVSLLYFHLHGFVYHFSDETFVLLPAAQVAGGGVIYRDIVVTYTPGAIWAVALVDRLFGVSVLSGRILMIFVSLAASVGIYKLITRISRKRFAPYLAVLAYLAWGPFQINWPAPGMFAVATGIWSCLFLIDRRLFWAGILTALTFLFKQNFGVAILITGLFFFRGKISWRYGLGVTVLLAVTAVCLILTGAWWPFIDVFDTYVINKFIFSGYASTPIRSIFYFGPVFVAIWFLWVCRQKSKWWFLAVFVGTFFLFGIRPVADYVHLAPLIALSGILLVVVSYPAVIILILSGLYLSLFGNYYRWGPPIVHQNYFDRNQKTMVFTTAQLAVDRDKIIRSVNLWAKGNEQIVVDDYAPWIYFFGGRNNATRFIFIAPGSLTPKWNKEIEDCLENKNVGLIITKEDRVANSKFHLVETVQGFRFWRRND